MRNLHVLVAVTCAAIVLPALACAAPVGDCHAGTYQLTNSSVVYLASSGDDAFFWLEFDGTAGVLHRTRQGGWSSTFGWTGRPDGKTVSFFPCAAGKIEFNGLVGRRVDFEVTDTRFHSRDVDLAGRLVLPKGRKRVPIIVLLHGSEHSSAIGTYEFPWLLPAEGVGVFVYDKRGTGTSAGTYTQDFDVLADDAIAAMHEARRIAGPRAGRVGYQGTSQGGWVGPLAAARMPVDFVIVSSGLAVSAIDEDQEEVALEMRLKGHSTEEITKALEVAGAAEAVIASDFTKGLEYFDAVRTRYRDEPWYKDLHGNFTFRVLPYTAAELREKGKNFGGVAQLLYDPMPTLRALEVPQLWILGEDDIPAPSAETSRRLNSLIADGKPITLALYPGAQHGLTQYETGPDGERIATRYSTGYFAMMRDFAQAGRLRGSYGSSLITKPQRTW
jgi:uncharacterized protein